MSTTNHLDVCQIIFWPENCCVILQNSIRIPTAEQYDHNDTLQLRLKFHMLIKYIFIVQIIPLFYWHVIIGDFPKRCRMLGLSRTLVRTRNATLRLFSQQREQMSYDVVTVGAGPAGLAAAIRLKQLAIKAGSELSICVVEKGAEVGAHILSGNVFEPHALNELFPNWKELGAPLVTKAGDDTFLILTEKDSYAIPHFLLPPQLHNEGNYIISLSQLVRWLATQAEELGVEIYSGFAADEVLYDESGGVRGVNYSVISLVHLIFSSGCYEGCWHCQGWQSEGHIHSWDRTIGKTNSVC